MEQSYKIAVFVPEDHATRIRQAMGDAGAGTIGSYSHCSFALKGVGRFTPAECANANIGRIDEPEKVLEDRIEVVCSAERLRDVLEAIKAAHP